MFKAGLRIGPDIGVNMTDMGTDVFPTPDTTLTDRCCQRDTPQAREGTKQSSVGFYRFPKAIQVLIANENSCAPSSLLTVNPWPSLADGRHLPILADIDRHWLAWADIARHWPMSGDIAQSAQPCPWTEPTPCGPLAVFGRQWLMPPPCGLLVVLGRQWPILCPSLPLRTLSEGTDPAGTHRYRHRPMWNLKGGDLARHPATSVLTGWGGGGTNRPMSAHAC